MSVPEGEMWPSALATGAVPGAVPLPSRRVWLAASLLGVLYLQGCASRSGGAGRSGSQPELRRHIAMNAMAHVGGPYRYGGRSPASGFDCSGLVAYAYQQAGLRLGGSAADMAERTQSVARSELAVADLVFFNTLGAKFSHVGIYLGDNRMVHAFNERTGVRLDSLQAPYFAQRITGYRTVLG